MKKGFLASLLTLIFVLSSMVGMAQFPGGGGGFPGGRRPGQRPPMGGDRQWGQPGQPGQQPTVKPKKKVREGDTFSVVGLLRDAKTGEYLPYVNLAVLDSIDEAFVKGGIRSDFFLPVRCSTKNAVLSGRSRYHTK